ncbi:hypothetical protein L0P54_06955 [Anaerosalibacter bizertensis]|uniref:hypothetical protein n=1 Tax=Anaerosalibacter bizertensis TaxID=932217 RepID=UPI001D0116A5|nr:hypothetical protein [Anaerosalibacter bizertensis]MBV1819531.1 hypothetical protein [Bacteroidales bacterium MSK.15.36]MCB5558357.1 hypothetical protein [Anaerosalibacter bizertensis]MCG4582721.1 hypothetical protein [Anaerosalibacter bizertensis]MCG4584143.1 hypothetical protein [Anaerosalibacter bizertensis]
MKEKSKFITFLLSFVPGLAHFYLGFSDRAIIFLMAFFGAILGVSGLAFLTSGEDFFILLVFILPIIWLIALIDSFSLRKKHILMEYGNAKNGIEYKDSDEIKKSNKKAITLALSIIPGAGHMYLGYQKKGLLIMGSFFFTVFFMGWLGVSLFLFVLPMIWFYGFFDAFHLVEGKDLEDEENSFVLSDIKTEWIGWGLITIGILIVIERILYPLIPYEIRNYIQTLIVSVIFIVGGIKLLAKNRRQNENNIEDIENIGGEDDEE